MKHLLTILFVLSTLFVSSQITEKDGAFIQVDKIVHDFGNVEYGSNLICEFIISNTGSKPLTLSSCKGSCGCTVPTCQPIPILPGQTYTMVVKYDSKREGIINKSVTIWSNSVNEPVKVVRIQGFVKPETYPLGK